MGKNIFLSKHINKLENGLNDKLEFFLFCKNKNKFLEDFSESKKLNKELRFLYLINTNISLKEVFTESEFIFIFNRYLPNSEIFIKIKDLACLYLSNNDFVAFFNLINIIKDNILYNLIDIYSRFSTIMERENWLNIILKTILKNRKSLYIFSIDKNSSEVFTFKYSKKIYWSLAFCDKQDILNSTDNILKKLFSNFSENKIKYITDNFYFSISKAYKKNTLNDGKLNINNEIFYCMKKIGEGTFGAVYLFRSNNNKNLIVKIYFRYYSLIIEDIDSKDIIFNKLKENFSLLNIESIFLFTDEIVTFKTNNLSTNRKSFYCVLFKIENYIAKTIQLKKIFIFDNQLLLQKMILLSFRHTKNINEYAKSELEVLLKIKKLSSKQSKFFPSILEYIKNENEELFIITNYIKGKDLGKIIKKIIDIKNLLQPEQYLCILEYLLKDLVKKVYILHEYYKVLHLDLKFENIIIDKNLKVQIIDYGSSINIIDNIYLDSSKKINSYELGILSKELMLSLKPFDPFAPQETEIGKHLDIWSLGIIFYFSLVGSFPFGKISTLKEIEKYKKNKKLFFKKKEKTIFSISELKNSKTRKEYELKSLINNILIPKFQKRLTIKQIIQSDFFSSYSIDNNSIELLKKIYKNNSND